MAKHSKSVKRQLESRLRNRQKALDRRSGGWTATVREAEELLDSGEWEEARSVLARYDAAHPGHPAVLRLLLDIYYQQKDFVNHCLVCQRLLAQDGENRPLHLMFASGCLSAGRPLVALQVFRRYVNRWPTDPMTESVRDTIAQMEPIVESMLQESPFRPEERLELGAMHEEMMACTVSGDFARAIEVGEKLLARSPGFVSAMNNLSQAYAYVGRMPDSISISRQVLELEPGNFHALGNLTRQLLITGQTAEAETICQRLRLAESDNSEIWSKKAETFSFLGDDAAVLDVFSQAEKAGFFADQSPSAALLLHLAGVAAGRQGDWPQARQHWTAALLIDPHLVTARENLADSKRPAGERNGPWAYSINNWFGKSLIDDLVASTSESDPPKDAREKNIAARKYAEKHPELSGIVPLLLECGDEVGRRLAQLIAFMLDTPPMHEALRAFCLSERGTDALRTETANWLSQKNLFPDGRVRMSIQGEWRDLELMAYEITEEPSGDPHSPEVEDWLSEGMQAIQRGDGLRAEMLFKKCLEIEPDNPTLLNNLCAAYEALNRRDESDALIRQIHERWPDYFFGRSNLAIIEARAGRFAEAERLLQPLRKQKRLHLTEYRALCSAQMHLLFAQRKEDSANTWLKMLKNVDPDHPSIEYFESILKKQSAQSLLRNFVQRRR